jgi:phage shock protein C
MYCTKCGVELRQDDRFCSRCAARTGVAPAEAASAPGLMLDKRNKKIAGVCAGLARHLELDVTLVRVLWLVVALSFGLGFVAYLAAWLVMPSDHGLEPRPAAVLRPQTT